MFSFLRSRLCFVLLIALAAAALIAIRLGTSWIRDIPPHGEGMVPTLPLIALAAGCALLLTIGLLIARKRGLPCLPNAGILWGITLVSVLCAESCTMLPMHEISALPLLVLLTAGSFCLLWALLRSFSLLFWWIFFSLELAQIAGYTQYGSRINSLVIAETLEASQEEISGYLCKTNLVIALSSLLGGAALCWLLAWVMKHCKSRLSLLNTGLVFMLLAVSVGLAIPPSQRHARHFWPCFETYSLTQACTEAIFHNQATIRQVESLHSPAEQPSSLCSLHGGEGVVLVVHIGESVRADRMSVNGYERDTTPWLRRYPNLINFPHCVSAACDTCQAQIAILTDARRDIYEKNPELQPHTGSVLDLFAAHGFRVFAFFGKRNATHLKYDLVVRLLTRCAEQKLHAPGSPWTSVPQMASVLRSLPKSQNTILFINNEGSHTPFYHYDHDNPPFQPAGTSFETPSSHATEVNNAYDNTVHYTDEFVRRVTSLLHGRPWLYLYISDHGEYLGHDGIWGRAALGESGRSYLSTTGCYVGAFILFSPELEAMNSHFAEALRTLRSHTTMLIAQEHIFHTLLGFFDLRTPWYNPALDLTSPTPQPYTGDHPEEENRRETTP